MKIKIAVAAVLATTLAGCSNESDKQAAQQAAAPAAQPVAQTQPAAAQPDPHAGVDMSRAAPSGSAQPAVQSGNRGVIKSVTQAGAYTYAEVETANGPLWIAANATQVQGGQEVAWRDGAMMRNFHSKALNRDFPQILFISGFISPDQLPKMNQAVVLSVQNAAGYSYVEADTERGREWLAVPMSNIKAGERIQWAGGNEMRNFHSSALDKDFDSIWFVAKVDVVN